MLSTAILPFHYISARNIVLFTTFNCTEHPEGRSDNYFLLLCCLTILLHPLFLIHVILWIRVTSVTLTDISVALVVRWTRGSGVNGAAMMNLLFNLTIKETRGSQLFFSGVNACCFLTVVCRHGADEANCEPVCK